MDTHEFGPVEASPGTTRADRLTSPSTFQREQALLGGAWTLLGLTTEMARDGDWLRATLGGRSVFVQRFGDTLRAFENVCAHRFFPLRTTDRGSGPIRCGFHHWQYNKEGLAVGIPKCADMFGCKPNEVGARLTPVEIDTCGTLIFGRLSGTAGDEPRASQTLRAYLGGAFDILKTLSDIPAAPRMFELGVAANWKLTCHISLDDYHLVAVHPDTFGKGGYLDPGVVRYHRLGAHSAYFYGGKDGDASRMAEECRAGSYRPASFRTFHIFPNVTFAHLETAGTWYVILQQHVPAAVDRTVLRTRYFPVPLPPQDRGMAHRIVRRLAAPWLPFLVGHYARKIGREDNEACERLQTVAGQATGPPMLARHEERIRWFEETYEEWTGTL